MTDLVFVYGTLKRGFRANYMLDSGVFLGEAETPPIFRMYGWGFPWLVTSVPGKCVYGELYEVNESTLKSLDRYEGFPNLYRRMKIPVRPFTVFKGYGENQLQAWVYHRDPERVTSSSFEIHPDADDLLIWLPEHSKQI